jgi:hypothetical protein
MIDAKQAILIAKSKAGELLDQASSNVEEIERHAYDGHDVWSITLSFPPSVTLPGHLAELAELRQYKRFLIDVETGDFLAVKIREPASQ